MSPFLLALGNREELVRNGKLTSIIFVRDVNSKGQEVSGYIDYAHRLRSTNFEPYFERRKKVCSVALVRWLINHSASDELCRSHGNDARGLLGQADGIRTSWLPASISIVAIHLDVYCLVVLQA